MTTINERIKLLVEYYSGGNNSKFANELDISEANVRNYISKTEPKFSVLEKIAKKFEISFEWLLLGEGEMHKPKMQDSLHNENVRKSVSFLEETKNTNNLTLLEPIQEYVCKMPQVVTVDKQGNDNVVLVPVKAQAGYLTGFGDPTYIKKLPTYNLPNIKNGTFRMFQVNGHSMHPTLHDKSYVVGEWVENWVKDIKDNRLYIVVAESDNAEGVLIKRVLNRLKKYGNLYLKPDNRKEYYNITLQPDEIKEVWEVKLYLGWELPDPAILYDRVCDLEADIEYLKDKLKGKN
ncbi:LexA family transcriptional regulator [Faecalibacter bovis]|uniref:Transcriptional regulator n=1 Tax=Faecalibacter bovis TaxID=2898187 RepID=A0ABX7XDQ8_9FLAO|nr:S24 family peptidase [Faecalibacter bovis]QTV06025.1 transcriptional regulator [Faecalibacter bovis]